MWAQAEVRKILAAIGARVLDDDLPVGQAHAAFAEDGSLTDPKLRETLATAMAILVHTARASEAVGTGLAQPQ